jgi:hypothetical protein
MAKSRRAALPRWRGGIAAVVVAIVAASVAASAADACVSSGSPPFRWYGAGVQNSVTQNNGLYSSTYVSSSGVVDCYGHINETIWDGVANSPDLTYWVEGGWTHGYHGNCGIWFYWGRNTPCCGYADHRVNNRVPTVGTVEPVEVLYVGGDTWSVYFNFVLATSFDGSVANITAGPNSQSTSFGLESTDSGNYSAATSTRDLQYQRLDGTWTNSVDAGATILCDSPANAYWVTTNVMLRSCMNASC